MTTTVELQDLRELENELAAAEREHDDALAAWRDLAVRETALTRTGMGLERRFIVVEGVTRDVDELDQVDRAALLSEVRAKQGPAAERLRSGRRRFEAAQVAVANARLGGLVAKYEATIDAADRKRRELERLLANVLITAIELGRARNTELRARNRIYTVVADGVSSSKNLREQLQGVVQLGDVPRRLDADSIEVFDGLEPELFGGSEDPLDGATWDRIAESYWLAITEPEKAEVRLRDSGLGRAAGL